MNPTITRLGKYEIRQVLGKGAMAVVYLGYDSVLEREVAIKVIASAILGEDELKQRFEREAKAIARLQHANIVTIYDLGYDDGGSPYIAMELLKGSDLQQKIKRASLGLNEKLSIVVQAAHGLAHAHETGLVHRDVKPANLFVTDAGATKVMDFGVARWAHSSQTQTGQILGTADYMPPEQIEGGELDGRADIFSLGVILYQLLTAKKPFEGQDYMTVFYKIVNVEPAEVVLPSGERIPELQAIVSRALAKDRESRYGTATQLAEDLRGFLRDRGDALSDQTLFGTSAESQLPATSARSMRGPATLRGEVSRRTMVGPLRPAATRPTEVHAVPVREAGPRPSSFGRIGLLAGIVVAVAAGSFYYFRGRRPEAPPAPAPAPVAAPVAIEDLGQFELAEILLERGKLAEANESVVRILERDPTNARALALREEILKRSKEVEVVAAASPPKDREVSPPAPRGPDSKEIAAQKAREAEAALGRGDLVSAQALVSAGEALDPAHPRWAELSGKIALKRQEVEEERDRTARASQQLQSAESFLAAGDLDHAISAYREVLRVDPNNVAAQTMLRQATVLKEQRAAAGPRFTESETEFIPAAGQSTTPEGFATEGVQAKSGTADAKYPAQLFIEHLPEKPRPGEPYVLQVRLQNMGQRALSVKSLELVTKLGDRPPGGTGKTLELKVRRVDAKAAGVLYEVEGVWSEERKRGSIRATVTLVGDDKLVKTTSW